MTTIRRRQPSAHNFAKLNFYNSFCSHYKSGRWVGGPCEPFDVGRLAAVKSVVSTCVCEKC